MQYGVLSHKWRTVEEKDEWEKGVRAVLQQMYDIDDIRSIDGTSEEDKIFSLYFPLKPRTHMRLLKDGLKVEHVVRDFIFYVGSIYATEITLNTQGTTIRKELDFGAMYREFEQKYNPYPVQMARNDAFRHALNDGLIDEDTYQKARIYYGKLWNYVGD